LIKAILSESVTYLTIIATIVILIDVALIVRTSIIIASKIVFHKIILADYHYQKKLGSMLSLIFLYNIQIQ